MNLPATSPHPRSAAGVSVIIPAYNYAHYLPDAIESVLAQTYPDIELLIVDDGSTDRTPAVVSRFGDALRYIYQDNAGLSAARNTGIRNATREYLAFLDADDLWKPTMIETLMARFERLGDEFLLVACQHENVDDKGRPLVGKKYDRQVSGEVRTRDILLKSRFMADAVIAKRGAFDTCGGFDTTLKSTEDRDMWLRTSRAGKIYVVPEPLLQVRCHPGSMSTHAQRMQENGWRVLMKAFHDGTVPKWQFRVWGRAISFHFFQAAWMFHDEGRSRHAVGQILRSMLCWPIFLRLSDLNEPPLFRLRAARRFLWCALRKQPREDAGDAGA